VNNNTFNVGMELKAQTTLKNLRKYSSFQKDKLSKFPVVSFILQQLASKTKSSPGAAGDMGG
jgi:hypothetical protein